MPSTAEIRTIVSDALQNGRQDLAAPWRDELLGNGTDPANLTLLGRLCAAEGDMAAALAYTGEAVRLEPFYVDAHIQRANFFAHVGACQEAARGFEQVLLFTPFFDDALGALIKNAQRAGRPQDALQALRHRVRIGGETAEVQNAIGLTSHGVGDLEGAFAAYSRAIELSPTTALYYSNLATILYHQEKYSDALSQLKIALKIDPDLSTAWYHVGNVLKASRHTAEAERAYRKAIALNPDYAEAHFALGCALLQQNKWTEGWNEYEWRWKVPGLVAPIHAGVPLWQGEDVAGRRIMVVAEQGSGDTLQYIRYARELSERGAEVYIWSPTETASLLQRLPYVKQVASNRFELPQCHYFVPTMSLPRLLGSAIEKISSSAYLKCNPELLTRFKRELGPRKKQLRIGLAWAGNPIQVEDVHRSAKLQDIASLFSDTQIRWISLQKGTRSQEIAESGLPIEDWSHKLTTFDETAALMSALDGVVSVCSSPIHLAGALGLRSVAMLAWAADWRWRDDDATTPYYSSVKIARMSSINAWDEVATRAAEIVAAWKPKVTKDLRSEK